MNGWSAHLKKRISDSRKLPYNELAPVEANITIEINKEEIMKLLERSQTNSESSITVSLVVKR